MGGVAEDVKPLCLSCGVTHRDQAPPCALWILDLPFAALFETSWA